MTHGRAVPLSFCDHPLTDALGVAPALPAAPSRDEIKQTVARLGPWVFRFRDAGPSYGGDADARADARVPQFFNFAPEAKSILELGSLEGAHAFLLAAPAHVERVVAVEGRARNLEKARFVQSLVNARKVEFVHANLEEEVVEKWGGFDAVFCSGILYHLPRPWELLHQLSRVSSKLFLWTHYCADEQAEAHRNGFYGRLYQEGGAHDPLSGMSPTSFWFNRQSLFQALAQAGYRVVDLVSEDLTHPEGPAITLTAEIP